jgi:hypothetical protein
MGGGGQIGRRWEKKGGRRRGDLRSMRLLAVQLPIQGATEAGGGAGRGGSGHGAAVRSGGQGSRRDPKSAGGEGVATGLEEEEGWRLEWREGRKIRV